MNLADWEGNTALHIVAKRNDHNSAVVLLDHPDICTDLKNADGETPLEVALYHNSNDVVSLLQSVCENFSFSYA